MEDREVLLRDRQEVSSNIKSLVESPGWKWLMEVAEGQKHNRLDVLLQPLDNILDVGKQEHEKGVIEGIKLFSLLPEIYQKQLEEEIAQLERDIENEQRNANAGDRGGDDDGAEFKPAV